MNAAALPKPRPIPVIKKAPRDPNAPKRKRGRPRKYDVNMVQPATIMTTSKLGEVSEGVGVVVGGLFLAGCCS